MRLTICAALAVVVLGGPGAPATAQPVTPAAPPPNVVLILADDLGYGDLSSYGHPIFRTPRIDRLGAEGARLTSYYSPAPSCTPSRVALLTGRYPIRTGLNNVVMPDDRAGLPQSEITLAETLKTAGYRTAMVGKWHLGHQPGMWPTDQGFDQYFGLPYSNDMIRPWVQTDVPLRLFRGTEALPGEVDVSTLTSRYTDEALQFMRANRDRPFFLYVAHSMPHVPIAASPAFAGTSAGGRLGDVLAELDWSTGRILDTLAELGLDRRTIVLFTSDNGPWLNMPPRMLPDSRVVPTDAGSPGPFRGAKATTWEGGVRVPFLARWPGRIPAGVVRDDVVTAMDVFVTVAGLARAAMPADRPMDGRDVWPVWTGAGAAPFEYFYYFNGTQLDGVRDARWKLRWNGTGSEAKLELYDLLLDPSERYDLARSHVDRVNRLSAAATAFARQTGAKGAWTTIGK
jgi:arylsulfatase A-like enzyme